MTGNSELAVNMKRMPTSARLGAAALTLGMDAVDLGFFERHGGAPTGQSRDRGGPGQLDKTAVHIGDWRRCESCRMMPILARAAEDGA
jgi:hypothetical protein